MTMSEYQDKMLKLFEITAQHVKLFAYIEKNKLDPILIEKVRSIFYLTYEWYFMIDVFKDYCHEEAKLNKSSNSNSTKIIISCNREKLSVTGFADKSFREFIEDKFNCHCVDKNCVGCEDNIRIDYTFVFDNDEFSTLGDMTKEKFDEIIQQTRIKYTEFYIENMKILSKASK